MHLLSDERGQAIQIGAVLLFGILILFLSIYQAFVVPDQNEEIEFNHNEDVQQQLTELRSNVILMPGSTSTRAASVDLGVRYPSRTIFVNPGPASGSLRTVGTENPRVNVTIDNATAVDTEGETGDYWNGTALSYDTGAIEYRPGYNLYANAPRTIYEHSVLYNRFEQQNRTLSITDQALVDDDRITLIALNGSLSESRVDTTSVDFDPISTRSRVVEVAGTDGPVTLRMPTGMSEAEWNATFEDELVGNGGHVRNVSVSAGGPAGLSMLEVTLETGQRYRLELAKVGVGIGATGTDATYLTDVAGDGSTVEKPENRTVTVEVRDAFNTPVSGVTVTADADQGTIESEQVSDEEGRATFEFDSSGVGVSPGSETDVGLSFSIGTTPQEQVEMNVTVRAPPESDGVDPEFDVFWNLTAFGDEFECFPAERRCEIEVGTNNADMAIETDPTTVAGFAEFAVQNRTVGELNRYDGAFDTGASDLNVRFNAENVGETNATVLAGGDRDTVRIETVPRNVTGPVSQLSALDVAGQGSDATITEGDDEDVSVTVENVGNEPGSFVVDLAIQNGDTVTRQQTTSTLDPGGTEQITFGGVTGTLDPGSYDVTVSTSNDTATGSLTVEAATALSGVSATDVVPNAGGQGQTFRFTLTEPLASGETVQITLDNAQSGLLNYGGNANVLTGAATGDANLNTNSGTTTITYTAENSGDASGLRIAIRADGIEADGGTATYDAVFERSDRSESSIDQFQVARGSGTSNISAISVSDVYEYGGTQTQTIEFTPDPGLSGGERVAIDLSDAQSTTAADRVEYEGVVGTGDPDSSASLTTTASGEVAYITYTAPDIGLDSTAQIDVEVTNAELSGSSASFEVGFSRASADTDVTTFDVLTDNIPPTITPVDPVDGDATDDDQKIIEATVTDDDSGVDESSISVTVEDANGNTPFDGAGTGTAGVDFTGNTLTIDISQQGESYPDGDVTVTVDAEDAVGNAATESYTFTVDTTPPTITNLDPPDGGQTTDNERVISADLTDGTSSINESTISVTVTDADGVVFDGAGTDATGVSFDGTTLTVDVSAIGETYAEGNVDVSVDVEDEAGNVGSRSWSFDVVTMEDTTSYVTDSARETGSNGQLAFDLRNTGNEPVEINGIIVNETSVTGNPPTKVDNDGNREFNGGGGFVNLDPGSIEIGASAPTPLDQTATIGSGSTETFNLEVFRKDNDKSANLNNKTVTITIYLSDGSKLTFTTDNIQ